MAPETRQILQRTPGGRYGSREVLLVAGAVCAGPGFPGPLVQASQRGILRVGASRDVGSRLLGQVCHLRVPKLAQPPRAGPQLKLCCVTESGASFQACPRPGPWVFFVAHRFGGSVCDGAPCGHLRGLGMPLGVPQTADSSLPGATLPG